MMWMLRKRNQIVHKSSSSWLPMSARAMKPSMNAVNGKDTYIKRLLISDAGMRSPLLLFVIGAVAALVIASVLYWSTQNPDEQHVRPGDSHVTMTFQGYARSYDLHVPRPVSYTHLRAHETRH